MTPRDRVIVALDAVEVGEARVLVERLRGVVSWVKVGSALFAAGGRPFVQELVAQGWHVFLDLKLHDIPHQVRRAVAVVRDLGAELLTLHTAGGMAMMEEALLAAQGSRLRLLGVTVLTSLDQAALAATGVVGTPEEVVLARARLARQAGLAGCVASGQEALALRRALGADFELVTPGIRRLGDAPGGQARTMTPRQALECGATRLVVGRPITEAADPRGAAAALLAELE